MAETAADILIDTIHDWGVEAYLRPSRRRHQWDHGGFAQERRKARLPADDDLVRAAQVLKASMPLMLGGYIEEACAWREWLLRAVAGKPSQLNIMYGCPESGGSLDNLKPLQY